MNTSNQKNSGTTGAKTADKKSDSKGTASKGTSKSSSPDTKKGTGDTKK
jgi:hypothetical protein